jgi:hypothetical protein
MQCAADFHAQVTDARLSEAAGIVGIACGLMVLSVPAEAGDTFRFKGQSADAFFSSTDPSGCIVTDVGVFASDDASISHDPPGPPTSSSGSGAFIFISQYDSCNGIQLIAADCFTSVPLADADFQVIGNTLDSATLNTTLGCFDYVSGGSFNVSVALTWTAIGNPVRQSGNSHFRTPGFIVNSRFSGTSRSATASGTVSDGTTNFTPNPTSAASIGNAKSGQVVID